MNIFVTDEDPNIAAQALDDLRVNKMIIKTAQLLSSAVRINLGQDLPDQVSLYFITHQNHPCAVWARESKGNFLWLAEHGLALSRIFKEKSKKLHASSLIIIEAINFSKEFHGPRTPFVNCTPFKDPSDTRTITEKYQDYMCFKWDNDLRKPTWTDRQPPSWYKTKELA